MLPDVPSTNKNNSAKPQRIDRLDGRAKPITKTVNKVRPYLVITNWLVVILGHVVMMSIRSVWVS